jgi:hypothetical protein
VPSEEEEMIVGALYGAVAGALLGSAQSLDLDNLGWGDDELEVLGAALGSCRALSGLNLAHNRSIGVRGLTALLVAPELTPGPTPKTALRPQHVLTTALRPQHRALRTLLLSGNPSIGDEGARVLATALHSLPALQVLALDACGLTDAGFSALVGALASGKRPPTIEVFTTNGNRVSDVGARALAAAAARGRMSALTKLGFGSAVTDAGVDALIGAAAGFVNLEQLLLSDSSATLTTLGAARLQLACRTLKFRHLETVDLTDWHAAAPQLLATLSTTLDRARYGARASDPPASYARRSDMQASEALLRLHLLGRETMVQFAHGLSPEMQERLRATWSALSRDMAGPLPDQGRLRPKSIEALLNWPGMPENWGW